VQSNANANGTPIQSTMKLTKNRPNVIFMKSVVQSD
jgi:hypothetical protein